MIGPQGPKRRPRYFTPGETDESTTSKTSSRRIRADPHSHSGNYTALYAGEDALHDERIPLQGNMFNEHGDISMLSAIRGASVPQAELDECAGGVFTPPGRDANHVDAIA